MPKLPDKINGLIKLVYGLSDHKGSVAMCSSNHSARLGEMLGWLISVVIHYSPNLPEGVLSLTFLSPIAHFLHNPKRRPVIEKAALWKSLNSQTALSAHVKCCGGRMGKEEVSYVIHPFIRRRIHVRTMEIISTRQWEAASEDFRFKTQVTCINCCHTSWRKDPQGSTQTKPWRLCGFGKKSRNAKTEKLMGRRLSKVQTN